MEKLHQLSARRSVLHLFDEAMISEAFQSRILIFSGTSHCEEGMGFNIVCHEPIWQMVCALDATPGYWLF